VGDFIAEFLLTEFHGAKIGQSVVSANSGTFSLHRCFVNSSSKSSIMIRLSLFFFFALSASSIFAQNQGVINGVVKDRKTQELLAGVSVVLLGTDPLVGTATDANGKFKLTANAGSYNVQASFIGYKAEVKYNVVVTSGNANFLTFELSEEDAELQEVEIKANRTIEVATLVTPLSVQRLSTEEIRSNPGGNFDISRVVQSLPGVAGTSGGGGFRNDIIIRGGAPNENVYYLDGIEIPVLNHFSTQGSAGGPSGILNVSFIEDVTLSSSAFDARYDNALASVFQFRQKEGNPDRVQGNIRLSGTEFATTLEGPLGPKTTFLASARRSYLQFLFQALDLPIRPNYWDFQTKITHRIDNKTTLTFLGIGAIDEFSFGVPRESTPEKEYILRSSPGINQWNYTNGVSLKRLVKNGFYTVALSRNMFDNRLDRFEDRREGEEAYRITGIKSQEIENKLRFDMNTYSGKWKFNYGVSAQYVKFNSDLYNRIRKEIRDSTGNLIQPAIVVDYYSAIEFFRYGAYGQVGRTFFKDRLGASFGLRTDMNSFTTTGNNPLKTLSPRLALSYALSEKWKLNGSVGTYYKLPIYTALGFRDANGTLVNRDNEYIRSTHYVAGFEYLPRKSSRITIEGFYKQYSNYPVSVRDGISLANQGGDFGSIGNEDLISNGKGRAYGVEVFLQQKLTKNFFGVLSYTYVRSEFNGADGKMISSSWDYRHLISGILGLKLKNGWEIGLKHRFAGGAPYTPFDSLASRSNYMSLGVGIQDLSQLNTIRLRAFNQTDLRVDKKWNYKKWTLDLYLDITNVLAVKNASFPNYTFARTPDNSAFATTDGQSVRMDGSNAIPLILSNNDATILPTIGFIIEF
jgi:hypothetical protein